MSFYDGPRNLNRQSNWDERGAPDDSYKPDRPVGVTILAALNFISVVLLVLNLLVAILSAHPMPPLPAGSTGTDQSIPDALRSALDTETSARNFGVLLNAVVGIPLGLVVGIGLWRLRSWGRTVALFNYGGGAILLLLLSYSRSLTGGTLTQIIISGAAFIYLLRPEVRAAFYGQREY